MQFAPLHNKSLEIEKDRHLKNNNGDYEAKCMLSQEAVLELMWWKNNIHDSFVSLNSRDIDLTIQTDNSNSGWGAFVKETTQKTGGHWSYSEQDSHINILELKAALILHFNHFARSERTITSIYKWIIWLQYPT